MADPALLIEPARRRRVSLWPAGLSARLLLLTVLIVVLANLAILPPNLAAFEEQRLLERVGAAEVATLVTQTAPNGVTAPISQKLLASAEVVQIVLAVNNERHLILQMPRVQRTPYLVDLRHRSPLSWIAPFETLFGGGDRMVRVMATPRFLHGDFVEIVAPTAPCGESSWLSSCACSASPPSPR